jgi:hypothetical protein
MSYEQTILVYEGANHMTVVVISSEDDVISLPSRLMAGLKWREGDEIKVILDGQTLRLTRLDNFLALRGALADDDAFDEAMEQIEQQWQSWTIPSSV